MDELVIIAICAQGNREGQNSRKTEKNLTTINLHDF